jgi:hypothetical protein
MGRVEGKVALTPSTERDSSDARNSTAYADGAAGTGCRATGRMGNGWFETVAESRFGMTWSPLRMTATQATGTVTAPFTHAPADSNSSPGTAVTGNNQAGRRSRPMAKLESRSISGLMSKDR